MKKDITRRIYVSPAIIRIAIDNEISLILESNPDGEPTRTSVEHFTNDPFKSNFG